MRSLSLNGTYLHYSVGPRLCGSVLLHQSSVGVASVFHILTLDEVIVSRIAPCVPQWDKTLPRAVAASRALLVDARGLVPPCRPWFRWYQWSLRPHDMGRESGKVLVEYLPPAITRLVRHRQF